MPAGPDPSLPPPTGLRSPLRWSAPLPELRGVWWGAQLAPRALLSTQPAPAATPGEPGPLLPQAVGVRGRGSRSASRESGGSTASRRAQSRRAGFPPAASAPFSTNTVRRVAIALARSLSDNLPDPIEGSSQVLFSLEDVHSLNNIGTRARPIDVLSPK